MIQKETVLRCRDNSGVNIVKCIKLPVIEYHNCDTQNHKHINILTYPCHGIINCSFIHMCSPCNMSI